MQNAEKLQNVYDIMIYLLAV